MGPNRVSLLPLEFVTNQRRVFAGRHFPFVLGAAQALHLDARWLCFSADLLTHKRHDLAFDQCVALDDELLEALKHHLHTLQPTHILMTHVPCQSVLSLLWDEAGSAFLLCLADQDPTQQVPTLRDLLLQYSPNSLQRALALAAEQCGWLLAWLGQPGHQASGQFLAQAFSPCYDCILANQRIRSIRPRIMSPGGMTCDYRAPLDNSPFYQDLDLSGCLHTFGCAFCTWHRGPSSDTSLDPVALFTSQVQRMPLRPEPGKGVDSRFGGKLHLMDIRLFHHLDALGDAICSLNMPPTTFVFEPRADAVVRRQAALGAFVQKMADVGHSVELLRMGAESLVETENQRLHKSITGAQQDEAMDLMQQWKRRYPNHFIFDPTWGYISCTPWTTLEEYSEGLEQAIQRGVDPTGVWLYTPLLLFRGAPILEAARRNPELLVSSFEDVAFLYHPAANNIQLSLVQPWRFRDARMSLAFPLVVRFCAAALRPTISDTVLRQDPLYETMLLEQQRHGPFRRADLFAQHVVAAVAALGPDGDPQEVFRQAWAAHLQELPPLQEASSSASSVSNLAASRQAVSPNASQASLASLASLASQASTPESPNAASAPAPTPSPSAYDPAAKVAYLAKAISAKTARYHAVAVISVEIPDGSAPLVGPRAWALFLEVHSVPLHLLLTPLSTGTKAYIRTQHSSVTHTGQLQRHADTLRSLVAEFLVALEKAIFRYAPELLPPENGA